MMSEHDEFITAVQALGTEKETGKEAYSSNSYVILKRGFDKRIS